ncbi:MAG: hypothetical protein HY078_13145 [Elusimicrobia bacterium]|nr:hypothetical protein [Elusimicrobiota bacterium]
MPAIQVFVDYPQDGERITSNIYSFRIGTSPQASKVEVSIDGGPWLPCRIASGYWWHDWICFVHGDHTVVARAILSDGTSAKSKSRAFKRAAS